jgi:hypothetical protein
MTFIARGISVSLFHPSQEYLCQSTVDRLLIQTAILPIPHRETYTLYLDTRFPVYMAKQFVSAHQISSQRVRVHLSIPNLQSFRPAAHRPEVCRRATEYREHAAARAEHCLQLIGLRENSHPAQLALRADAVHSEAAA